MAQGGEPRKWRITLALGTALITALALYRWTGTDRPPLPVRPSPAAPSAAATVIWSDMRRATVRPRWLSLLRNGRENTAPPQPKGSVFDLATLTPPNGAGKNTDTERFPTNDWFTDEDLQHPELYFEMAKQMPELNRSEERQDTLAFFLAYRSSDIWIPRATTRASVPGSLAAIDRYDHAIAELQTHRRR
jgi:hypothetical protein